MNTPKKAVKFSNELQLQKPIPHLVFVVFDSKNYKTSILKILLHFHFHVNPSFTFSFLSNGSAAKVYEFCAESLQELLLTTVTPIKGSISDAIKIIHKTIHEVKWNQTSEAVPLQSPVKTNLSWAKNVKIRNYLLMVRDLPESISDLQSFVESESKNQVQLLESLNDHLLLDSLWTDLAQRRISICWLHQHVVSKEFSLTEAWVSCLFKLCGSLTLNESLLDEMDFSKLWEGYLQPAVMDLALIKLLCRKATQLRIFDEHIDKAFVSCGTLKYPEVWSGSASIHEDVKSWPTILPNVLNCKIACKKIPGIELLEYSEMKIIGIAECGSLPQICNEDGFCVPSLGRHGLQDFAFVISFLAARDRCLIVKFSEKGIFKTAAIRSLAPSLAGFYLMPPNSNITVLQYEEARMVCKKRPICDISPWLEPKWPAPLSHFLRTGKIQSKQTEFIQKLCLGVWRVENSAFVSTPKPKERFLIANAE